MLSKADHERIAEAITDTETRTRGEIFCVLAQEVSRYREVPLAWGAFAALVVPPFLILPGLHGLTDDFSGWSDGTARAAQGMVVEALGAYGLLQAAIFAVVVLLVAIPSVRRLMTPRFLKRHRVQRMARHHFAASGARHGEPHVLIYASLHDRQVEIVAHDAIHSVVGEAPWAAAAAAVIQGMKAGRPGDGFVAAIGICGAALAEHFPPDGAPKNQLPNDILET